MHKNTRQKKKNDAEKHFVVNRVVHISHVKFNAPLITVNPTIQFIEYKEIGFHVQFTFVFNKYDKE